MRLAAPLLLSLALVSTPAIPADDPLRQSVEQLRYAIGTWDVTTTFIDVADGTSRAVDGSYSFEWVVEDRVVSGRSDLPALQRSAALLFYVNPGEETIEMVSVGADGHLWIMTGPLGSETRYTQTFEDAAGNPAQLRFTRYNVSENRFESKMEITTDGGETWTQANHQLFERQAAP